jgi:bifunctional non-homologous end joining protein LigD
MITPMVARLVPDPFDREGWLFELKWDGFRAIAKMDGQGATKLYSRNHNDFKKRFPPIAQALAELGRPAILDGEIVALDDRGHARFEWLVNRGKQQGTLVYYVFDLLMLDGKDLRQLALGKRKQRLARLLAGHPHLLEVEHIEEEASAATGRPATRGNLCLLHWLAWTQRDSHPAMAARRLGRRNYKAGRRRSQERRAA